MSNAFTATQARKFKMSARFEAFAKLHETQPNSFDAPEIMSLAEERLLHATRLDLRNQVQAAREASEAEYEAQGFDSAKWQAFTSAEGNALDTANVEKVFEEDSIAFFQCLLGGLEA